MGAGRGARLVRKKREAAARAKAVAASAQGKRERAALAQAQAEANKRAAKQPRRRGPISNTAIKGAARAVQARAAQILGQRSLSTVAAIPLTRIERIRAQPKRKDPRIVARENKIAIRAQQAKAKFLQAAREAEISANRRAQKNRSAILGSARFRSNKRSKKELQAEANRQSANAIKQGKEKAARIRAAGQAKFNEIIGLAPTQDNVFLAGQISAGVSTKKSRQRASKAASATATRAGTVASQSFATGGLAAGRTVFEKESLAAGRLAGQEKAATTFAKKQSRTSIARARKSSTLTQKAPTVTRQTVVGLQVVGGP